jgi:glycerol-3-phosphate acyltransferase PlsY
MLTLLAALAAYLIGSISFAVVTSWLLRLPDPRTYGSGNPGATNVLRTGRKGAALATLIGDAAKGGVAVLLARWLAPGLGLGEAAIAAVAVAAFVGHLYPVYFRFQGGKGVATAFGLLLALDVRLALAALAVFLAVAIATRYVSLASVLAAVVAAALGPWLLGWGPIALGVVVMAALIVWRHRSNLQRLLAGQENKVGLSKPTPPTEQA